MKKAPHNHRDRLLCAIALDDDLRRLILREGEQFLDLAAGQRAAVFSHHGDDQIAALQPGLLCRRILKHGRNDILPLSVLIKLNADADECAFQRSGKILRILLAHIVSMQVRLTEGHRRNGFFQQSRGQILDILAEIPVFIQDRIDRLQLLHLGRGLAADHCSLRPFCDKKAGRKKQQAAAHNGELTPPRFLFCLDFIRPLMPFQFINYRSFFSHEITSIFSLDIISYFTLIFAK